MYFYPTFIRVFRSRTNCPHYEKFTEFISVDFLTSLFLKLVFYE